MNKTNIIHTTILTTALALTLAACENDFDMDKLHSDPMLAVYCFPTEGDTTVITVLRTVPVTTGVSNPDTLAHKPVDAHVVYRVNGREMPVRRITQADLPHLSADADRLTQGLLGHYCAIAPQQAGDRIELEVRTQGLPTATASTHIPARVEARIDTVEQDVHPDGSYYTVNRMNATFADNESTKDYYMVRIDESLLTGEAVGYRKRGSGFEETFMASTYEVYLAYKDAYERWDFSELKWRRHLVSVDTRNEPVFINSSQLDEDFGLGSYHYRDNAYFFNDQLFNGKTYTLHLNINKGISGINDHYNFQGDWDEYAGGYYYKLQFCTLTKEYYRFIKSMTDNDNNDWANNGLMSATPVYSNVNGGFGIVAGYAASVPVYHVEVADKHEPSF